MAIFDRNDTLYISDMDGTLLTPDATLSDYTVETLNRLTDGGMRFTVATARTSATANIILSRLATSAPVILMNGAVIRDRAANASISVAYINPEAVTATINALAATGIKAFMYELRDDNLTTWHEPLTTEPMRKFVAERVAKYYKNFNETEHLDNVPSDHIIYFTILDTQSQIQTAQQALAVIPRLDLTSYRDVYGDQWFLEAFSQSASKKQAALYVKKRYGFKRIVGFGDNLNDLSLFEACDYKLAVENAHPAVKAAADAVIAPNTSDGVARWLEENA